MIDKNKVNLIQQTGKILRNDLNKEISNPAKANVNTRHITLAAENFWEL